MDINIYFCKILHTFEEHFFYGQVKIKRGNIFFNVQKICLNVTIIIIWIQHMVIIKFPKLLFLLRFLLLHHPDCCRVMYCYSTFLFHYYSYSYYSYSSTHFCPLDFSEMPWSNFMKPCKEYHMPCEVVLLRFDFFKMAAVAM